MDRSDENARKLRARLGLLLFVALQDDKEYPLKTLLDRLRIRLERYGADPKRVARIHYHSPTEQAINKCVRGFLDSAGDADDRPRKVKAVIIVKNMLRDLLEDMSSAKDCSELDRVICFMKKGFGDLTCMCGTYYNEHGGEG